MGDRPPLRTLVVLWLTMRFCRVVLPLAYGLLQLGLHAEFGLAIRFATRICRAAERALEQYAPRP